MIASLAPKLLHGASKYAGIAAEKAEKKPNASASVVLATTLAGLVGLSPEVAGMLSKGAMWVSYFFAKISNLPGFSS